MAIPRIPNISQTLIDAYKRSKAALPGLPAGLQSNLWNRTPGQTAGVNPPPPPKSFTPPPRTGKLNIKVTSNPGPQIPKSPPPQFIGGQYRQMTYMTAFHTAQAVYSSMPLYPGPGGMTIPVDLAVPLALCPRCATMAPMDADEPCCYVCQAVAEELSMLTGPGE